MDKLFEIFFYIKDFFRFSFLNGNNFVSTMSVVGKRKQAGILRTHLNKRKATLVKKIKLNYFVYDLIILFMI
ncbi:hypothetical protein [Xenorhabdus sp. BG5]|uniref:hypothetical protein n=1 Tax=Xenorhabdus sp. BG5 TaxID=2782014 RepID=UPI0030DCC632